MKKIFLILSIALTASWSYAQVVTGTVNDISCNGMVDGSISLDVTGGSGAYSFVWEGPSGFSALTQNISGLEAGDYSVTVVDIPQKSPTSVNTVEVFTISEPTAITVLVVQEVDVLCPWGNTGIIEISASGGTVASTYTYMWYALVNTGFYATTDSIFNLSADTYTVNVTDDNGCVVQQEVVITEPAAMQITEVVTDVSCFGANDGSIDLTVTGGAGSPTFLWDNGETTEDLTGLSCDGANQEGKALGCMYNVVVTDANGCESYNNYYLNEPDQIYFDLYTMNSNCENSDGTAEVMGASGNIEILWSTGETGVMASNLSSGIYSVEVADIDFGCSAIKYFFIEDNSGAIITPQAVSATCPNCNDGQISLDITGGQAPHDIQWSNSATGAINDNLYPGSYSATITDALGCVNNICVYVGNTYPMTTSSYTSNASSCGASDGSATVYAYDGQTPYTFQWDDSGLQSTQTATNLSAGYYQCTVTDASLQQEIVTVAVGEVGGPTIIVDASGNTECGLDNGYINVSFSGGTGSYAYLWSEGTLNQNLTNAGPGEYYVYVNDGVCASSHKFNVYSNSDVMDQPICIVSVDSVTDHNLIVWENVQADGVDHYNIYSEGCGGQFDLIGSVDANAITVFEDVNSLPFSKSYSYKLTAVNACGDESMMSAVHKTIHLEINLDEAAEEAQLIWDDYIGFPNPVFKIYKKTIDLGWTEISEVPNTDYSFVDYNYNDTTISYAVVVEKPDGSCDAWNGNNKASGGPYYQSVSNLEDEGIVNHTQIGEFEGKISIYPNPANNILNIENSELIQSVKIYDVTGKLVSSYRNINQNAVRLNTQNFESGIYVLEVQAEELIKQRIVFE